MMEKSFATKFQSKKTKKHARKKLQTIFSSSFQFRDCLQITSRLFWWLVDSLPDLHANVRFFF